MTSICSTLPGDKKRCITYSNNFHICAVSIIFLIFQLNWKIFSSTHFSISSTHFSVSSTHFFVSSTHFSAIKRYKFLSGNVIGITTLAFQFEQSHFTHAMEI